ncbi:hypothetical protein CYMTET_4621 [Cymbomonas tetramitiformis]|uniref:Uncharacterized protein n=1 Tax=Cymbomonas tetramitiformis TaxID=36881 RepID=A0AAE0H106_9CHLO|nr:hypothetical protein CYMTET_4621 [Cymbomonas tetramitiformis]
MGPFWRIADEAIDEVIDLSQPAVYYTQKEDDIIEIETDVCSASYQKVCKISQGYFCDVCERVLSGRTNFIHGLTGSEANRRLSNKKSNAVAFVNKYAAEQGEHQADKPETHLPSGKTREEIWDDYLDSLSIHDRKSKEVSLPYFYEIWKDEFKSWLKVPKCKRFSQCSVCASIKLLKEGTPKSQHGPYDTMREVHLNQARAEREKFYKHGRKSNMTKSIKENETWWKYSSVIIDGMTQ